MADKGILAPFKAPPASKEMFASLQDRTNVFDDPLGSKTLGAVNRAIVGTPIDIVDYAGRTGEAMLRGAAKVLKALWRLRRRCHGKAHGP